MSEKIWYRAIACALLVLRAAILAVLFWLALDDANAGHVKSAVGWVVAGVLLLGAWCADVRAQAKRKRSH